VNCVTSCVMRRRRTMVGLVASVARSTTHRVVCRSSFHRFLTSLWQIMASQPNTGLTRDCDWSIITHHHFCVFFCAHIMDFGLKRRKIGSFVFVSLIFTACLYNAIVWWKCESFVGNIHALCRSGSTNQDAVWHRAWFSPLPRCFRWGSPCIRKGVSCRVVLVRGLCCLLMSSSIVS